MKVNGQFHAPATLFPGKEPPVLTGWVTEWAPEPARPWWQREKKSFPAPRW